MSYDGPYCSERMGPNYGAGSTGSEMREYWGDPSNGDYDPDFVVAVEKDIAERNLVVENEQLRQENEALREQLRELRLGALPGYQFLADALERDSDD